MVISDNDGLTDQIYSYYGARSFSIFDAYGNMVYDSGEDFDAQLLPSNLSLFNNDEGEKTEEVMIKVLSRKQSRLKPLVITPTHL
ncbi:MAG: hypothetical protein R2784_20670 [Saprospiraceae bacterium]